MNKNNIDEYDDILYPLTDLFEKVTESNYLQYSQLANIQYSFLSNNHNSSGYHFVNWRVNFSNLHEYIILNQKSNESIISFLKIYENSVPLLYKMLGLKY